MVESCFVEKNVKGIGTIDALTSGFNLIARRPWAILLPVAINLFIWLGPKAGIAPLVQEIADGLRATATLQSGPYGEWVQSVSQALADWGDATNLFALLAAGIPILAIRPQGHSALHLDTWPGVAGLSATLLLAGICLLALYAVIIAQEVRGSRVAIGPVVGWVGRVAWRVVMLGVVLLGIATVIALPGLTIVGILSLFSPQGAAILSTLLAWAALFLMIWLLFYLFFVLDAIALDDVGVRHAVSRSVVLVRQNAGPTLALILLTILLGVGLGEVWFVIAKSTPGIVAGIIANAYVSTALAAASMIFYSSRWYALQKQFGVPATPMAEKALDKDQTDRPNE